MSEPKKVQESTGNVGREIEISERRRHDRFTAGFEARVSMTNENGRRVDVDAWVLDVSASGLGLSCLVPFVADDVVTVRAPGRSLQCLVRHSRPDGERHTIGLELLSTSDGTDIQGSLRELGRSLRFVGHARSSTGDD
jgi:hypothetical protein